MPTQAELESRRLLDASGVSRAMALGQESGDALRRGKENWVTATGSPTPRTLADWMALVGAGSAINVRDPEFGATGDGVTDDTAALLAAVAAAKAAGKILRVPAGIYRIDETLDLVNSFTSGKSNLRFGLVGDGPGVTHFLWDGGSGPAIRLKTDQSPGFSNQSLAVLSGFSIYPTSGSLRAADGLVIEKCDFFEIRDVHVLEMDTGVKLDSSWGGNLHNVIAQYNNIGFETDDSLGQSSANSVNLYGCRVLNSVVGGALLTNPGSLVWVGGSVEGNGTTPEDGDEYGIRIVEDDTRIGGSPVSAHFIGLYVEYNAGIADIHIRSDQSAENITVLMEGISFNRGTKYSTHNIYIDQNTSKTVTAVVSGCSHAYDSATYTPDVSRPYIQYDLFSGSVPPIQIIAPTYQSATEAPAIDTTIIAPAAMSLMAGSLRALRLLERASAVNYATIQGGATGGAVTIAGAGPNADVGLVLEGKGSGAVTGYSNGQPVFLATNPSTSRVNRLGFRGNVTGFPPQVRSESGTDTNVDLALVPQGTGVVEVNNGIRMVDAANIAVNATTGSKIGTASTQKLGFWNATPAVQPAAQADASGGATVDAEARTAINGLLAKLRTIGIIAT
jgi:hypothetical protein